ncbi:hypothetical protein R3P38DRAFT_2851391 [Favolaschia claudopus]|uniref:Uncharacterized protein n=1 Tax=Favolaschia claudopus TaxID=2862362 RepID=A0AAW0DQF3_9AGAR
MFPRTLSSLYTFTSAISLLQITLAGWAILSFGFNTETSSAGIHSFIALSAIAALFFVYIRRHDRKVNFKSTRTIYGEIQIIVFFMAFWLGAGVLSIATFILTLAESSPAAQREFRLDSFARFRCAILGINACLPFVHCLIFLWMARCLAVPAQALYGEEMVPLPAPPPPVKLVPAWMLAYPEEVEESVRSGNAYAAVASAL